MPIGGFVVTLNLAEKDQVLDSFSDFPEVEVHGVDAQGNAVVVIDTETSDRMEEITRKMQQTDGVLSVGATYFHAEDEIEKIERGELTPSRAMGRKGEKSTDRT